VRSSGSVRIEESFVWSDVIHYTFKTII